MSKDRNREIYEKALEFIPGGVNSPVRAFKSVGGDPVIVKKGKGSRITDENGKKYIDYCCSWGPLILGHAPEKIVGEVRRAARRGLTFGISTAAEARLASMICDAVPSIKKVRLVSSGTEATMSAIRAARGFTGRDKIIKFDGCYHGHADYLLAGAGSGVATLSIPDSAGVPASFTKETILAKYNDLPSVSAVFKRYKEKIAAVIVEPVAGNMGVVMPEPEFLAGLRTLCDENGALLIFDEVITGFRLGRGGAQKLFGVMPDMTCLGKIIGGGLPMGAYGGRADIMDRIAPLGDVYQAGTLSGNPVSVAAGMAALKILKDKKVYRDINEKAEALCAGIRKAAERADVVVTINLVGSMFTVFFTGEKVVDYATAKTCDTQKFAAWFNGMRERGVYLSPSQFEANFTSAAHSWKDIDRTISAAKSVMKKL